MKNPAKNFLAFTLIELLVVISIIGILTTLLAANMNAARERARDAQRKSDLKNISTALRLYYNDNGQYPDSDLDWGNLWTNTSGSTVYMNKVPQDPLPGQTYTYERTAIDVFALTACLENASDKQGVASVAPYNCNSGTMFQIIQQ